MCTMRLRECTRGSAVSASGESLCRSCHSLHTVSDRLKHRFPVPESGCACYTLPPGTEEALEHLEFASGFCPHSTDSSKGTGSCAAPTCPLLARLEPGHTHPPHHVTNTWMGR